MDPLLFLANLLLSVTIGTLIVALVVYFAYKVREKRKPITGKSAHATEDGRPVFLRRYMPGDDCSGRQPDRLRH